MTKAMPFLQKVILLSYDPRPLAGGASFWLGKLPALLVEVSRKKLQPQALGQPNYLQ